jgi:PAS domain S-box-containing protein
MEDALRILLVEDSLEDAELLRLHLKVHGVRFEMTRAESLGGVSQYLARNTWDLVLCDFFLHDTNGLEVLRLLREGDPDLPFILVSGVLDEAAAVQAMRCGANDFILKGNLSRLVPALEREIREHGVRRQRRAFEAELKLLHAAIGQCPDLVIITQSDGTIAYANPAAERLSGYSRAELMGHNTSLFRSDQHDGAFYDTIWRTLRQGGNWHGRLVLRRKDGSPWDTESVLAPVNAGSEGQGNGILISQDRTHERKLEALLEHTQRLETIGVLTSGIAHDFNNMLTPMLGYAELSLRRPPGDPRVREDLKVILESGERAAQLVRQILYFSRGEARKAVPLEFQTLLRQSLKLMRATLPTALTFEVELDADKRWVTGDPTKLHQVVLNLCVNAMQAMSGTAGRLTVRLQPEHLPLTPCVMGVFLPEGDYLRLEVKDTGRGIPLEDQDKIFLTFFTTKADRGGTGLGLSLSHGIVSAMGGGIQFESRPGVGTVFRIFLPEARPVSRPPRLGIAPMKGQARVLLVDDDLTVLSTLKAGLEHLGFLVSGFSDPLEALEAFRRTPQAFDVLLTDDQMPGKNGTELAQEFLALRPELPAILFTGSTLHLETQTPFRALLNKPMPPGEVARFILESLAPASP